MFFFFFLLDFRNLFDLVFVWSNDAFNQTEKKWNHFETSENRKPTVEHKKFNLISFHIFAEAFFLHRGFTTNDKKIFWENWIRSVSLWCEKNRNVFEPYEIWKVLKICSGKTTDSDAENSLCSFFPVETADRKKGYEAIETGYKPISL